MKGILSGFNIDKYKKLKPPKDNSLVTLKELKEINGMRKDPSFVKEKDNQESAFKKITEAKGLPFPKKLISDSKFIYLSKPHSNGLSLLSISFP